MKTNRVVENIIALLLLQGANYFLPLITLPYLVRVLGVEKFGIIAFSQAFIQYFMLITDYGFNLTATQQISRLNKEKEKIDRILSSVTLVKFFLFIFSWILMNSIILMIPYFTKEILLYNITFISVLGNVLFPIWYFQGLEEMKYITILNVTAKVIITILIFLFIHDQQDYIYVAFIQALTTVIPGVLSWIVIYKFFSNRFILPSLKEGKSEIIKQLKDGWHIFLSTVAISLYTSSNLFILGLLTNSVIVGYYSAADKIIKAIQGILGSVTQAIYPHTNSIYENSKEAALHFIRKTFIAISIISFLSSLGIFLFSEQIVLIILGKDYIGSIDFVKLMAFLPFIIALSNVFGIQTMLTFGYKKEFSRILLYSGALNIILIIPLTFFYKGIGAASSVIIVETIITLTMMIFLIKKGIFFIKIKSKKREY